MKIRVFDRQKFQIEEFRTLKDVKIWIGDTVSDYKAEIKTSIMSNIVFTGNWERVFEILRANRSVIFKLSEKEAYIVDIRK